MTKILSFLACTLVVCSAHASIISDPDGLEDTNTGLSWLNLSNTVGLSYDQVNSELGTGGSFSGFHFATFDDVLTLFNNAGVLHWTTTGTPGNRFAGDTFGPFDLSGFFQLIGNTTIQAPSGDFFSCSAQLSNGFIQAGGTAIIGHHFCESEGSVATDEIDGSINEKTATNPSDLAIGSWLVRTASVPEPSSVSILAAGLMGLAVARRRLNVSARSET